MTHAVEARALTKRFDAGRAAVDRVSLTVERGEIYALLGPNGAGKSTAIHMLTTLLAPTSGAARVCGWDVARDRAAVRRAIGVALQDVALDPLLTGSEHLRLQGALQGLSRTRRRGRAADVVRALELDAIVGRRVRELSGGMRRRLDLALALLHEPAVLFLDEPTTGLDPGSRRLLWDTVGSLRDDGLAIVLTTQYLEEADALADRIGILVAGQLVAEDTPGRLKRAAGRFLAVRDPTLDDVYRLHVESSADGEGSVAAARP